ncbi:hypothetical protein HDU93_009966 [Gonapodya sp. JEL0774]|nr:hypothetical protein HDU93_009966 [Gonapodya sp. JEL0774]
MLYAAHLDNPDIIQLLGDLGVEADARPKREGWVKGYGGELKWAVAEACTPLMLAARRGNTAAARALLASTPPPSPSLRDAHSWTALHRACWNGRDLLVVLLIDQAGASVDEPDASGWTGLMRASWNGHRECVERVVERGAEINLPDNHGQTALHLACANGQPSVVETLLELGARTDLKDVRGATPLDLARLRSNTSVVAVLHAHHEKSYHRTAGGEEVGLSMRAVQRGTGRVAPVTTVVETGHETQTVGQEARVDGRATTATNTAVGATAAAATIVTRVDAPPAPAPVSVVEPVLQMDEVVVGDVGEVTAAEAREGGPRSFYDETLEESVWEEEHGTAVSVPSTLVKTTTTTIDVAPVVPPAPAPEPAPVPATTDADHDHDHDREPLLPGSFVDGAAPLPVSAPPSPSRGSIPVTTAADELSSGLWLLARSVAEETAMPFSIVHASTTPGAANPRKRRASDVPDGAPVYEGAVTEAVVVAVAVEAGVAGKVGEAEREGGGEVSMEASTSMVMPGAFAGSRAARVEEPAAVSIAVGSAPAPLVPVEVTVATPSAVASAVDDTTIDIAALLTKLGPVPADLAARLAPPTMALSDPIVSAKFTSLHDILLDYASRPFTVPANPSIPPVPPPTTTAPDVSIPRYVDSLLATALALRGKVERLQDENHWVEYVQALMNKLAFEVQEERNEAEGCVKEGKREVEEVEGALEGAESDFDNLAESLAARMPAAFEISVFHGIVATARSQAKTSIVQHKAKLEESLTKLESRVSSLITLVAAADFASEQLTTVQQDLHEATAATLSRLQEFGMRAHAYLANLTALTETVLTKLRRKRAQLEADASEAAGMGLSSRHKRLVEVEGKELDQDIEKGEQLWRRYTEIMKELANVTKERNTNAATPDIASQVTTIPDSEDSSPPDYLDLVSPMRSSGIGSEPKLLPLHVADSDDAGSAMSEDHTHAEAVTRLVDLHMHEVALTDEGSEIHQEGAATEEEGSEAGIGSLSDESFERVEREEMEIML